MNTRILFSVSGSIHLTGGLIATILAFASLEAGAITLTGSNGRAAELLGIKDATPKGLTAQTVAEGPTIGIPWAKLDLAALERDQKLFFAAYQRAVAGETIALDLGSFAENKPAMAEGAGAGPVPMFNGWTDTNVGGKTFAIQMPLGAPRGILLMSIGESGRSMSHVAGWDKGDGPWAEFQTKYGLAILSYQYKIESRDPTVMDSFAFAEKGSGQQVLNAISDLAKKLKKPELVELPIAVYGMNRSGAAFAYHFALWKPEIILGAVLSKGGFYNAEPSEAAAKVPMVFVWGQYGNNHELWANENSADHILKKYASMKPNWTSAMEFRGTGRRGQKSDQFTTESLKAILDKTLPEKGAVAKPKEKPKVEGAEVPAEGEKEEEEVKDEPPKILPFDRSKGMVGNLKTKEVLKIVDPEAELAENETFIISGAFARSWKQFISGEYEASGN